MFPPLNRRAFGSAGSVFFGGLLGVLRLHPYTEAMIDPGLRIGVVGATGAVGRVTLQCLVERGYTNIRTFASWRSAGGRLGDFEVEEATARALGAGDLDICFFSIGTQWSKELVPVAAEAGAVCIDKSSAFRLEDGVPLVVPEVNAHRALVHSGIVANPNCCTIPLTMVLAPLHNAAGLRSVRLATYQSVSGAGSEAIADLRAEDPDDHMLAMDWSFDGVEFDEESKIREETRKILELPDLPISATCVRVPVVVGHAEAVWIETESPLSASEAERVLKDAPGLRLQTVPVHSHAIGTDDVLVGRVRQDPSVDNGLALFIVCDNLRKGAALNAIQIAELRFDDALVTYAPIGTPRGRPVVAAPEQAEVPPAQHG
jgi:aspartate-semialdehyde dehydrogenase